jgi:competence protein ComEC
VHRGGHAAVVGGFEFLGDANAAEKRVADATTRQSRRPQDVLAFAISFLGVFMLRAELPRVGREVAAGVILAVAAAVWRRPRAAARIGKDAVLAAVLGGALACALPAAREPAKPMAGALDAEGSVARVEGIVEAGGRVDPRGCWFRLRGGPAVRVAGAASTPPPLARIAAVGRLDAAGTLLVAASTDALEMLAEPPVLAPARLFEWLRQLCRERIHAACGEDRARVLLPLLIGDPGLPEDFRDELARTGTLHVIAVSGTHLSLFLAGLRIFTRRLRVLVPMLVIYAGLCAFQPPVLRSLVLCVGFLCGRRLGRALPQGSHFLISAVVVLACDPEALFDAGFQLSFSAFGGIIAFAGRRDEAADPFAHARATSARSRVLAKLRPAVRAGGGATLATAPAMIWRFNRISPIGVPATLLLSPFIPVLLWLGVAIVLFPSVPALPRLAGLLIDLLVLVTSALSSLPFASVDVARPHGFALAALAATIVAIALATPPAWTGARIGVVALMALGVMVPDRTPTGLYQLAAGRGSATLLVTREAAALVDAGPESARVAEQVLKLGVRRLDLVLLSHEHADHVGGLAQILARLAVGRVGVGPSFEGSGEVVAGRPVEAWEDGTRFEAGRLGLAALWPPASARGSSNDRSLVVAADVAGLRALLCGDVETDGLRALLRTRRVGRHDVVLAPHHGGSNDALGDLLLRTRPATVLLSNRPGGAAEETLALLEALPVVVRATWTGGMITIRSPTE